MRIGFPTERLEPRDHSAALVHGHRRLGSAGEGVVEPQHAGMNPRRWPRRSWQGATFFGTCQIVPAACVIALMPAAIGLGRAAIYAPCRSEENSRCAYRRASRERRARCESVAPTRRDRTRRCPLRMRRCRAIRREHVRVLVGRPVAHVDIADWPEKSLHQVERMDAHVLERIPAVSESSWERAAGVRRIVGGAMEIDGEHVAARRGGAARARARPRDRPWRSGSPTACVRLDRRGDHLVAFGDRWRHRLFDEDVAAHFERFDREPGVRGRRCQDVDDVGTRCACPKGWQTRRDREALGQRVRPIDGRVGDPDDADVRKCLQGADVVAADVSRADQRDTSFSGCAHKSMCSFCQILCSTISTISLIRASHVMAEVASIRRARSASVSLNSASSIS